MDPSELAGKVAVNVVTEILKSSLKGLREATVWFDALKKKHDPFGIAARRYVERLKDVYGTVRIFDMGRPRTLLDIYVRVNVLPKRTGSIRKPRGVLLDEENEFVHGGSKAQSRRPAPELIGAPDFEKVLVLGKPGSGKTTLLKYLAVQALEERIPVYVALRDWTDPSSDLLQLICEQFEVCGFPDAQAFVKRMLKEGKLLLLLDGLDEVVGDRQRDARNKIRRLVNKYPENHFVISYRIAAYPYVFEQFTEVELADFDHDQIEKFADRWFADAPRKAKLFWDKINEPANRPVLKLASNPLLLTMLCLVFEDLLDFLSNRSQLYKEAIDVFLKKWDASQGIERDWIYKQLPLKNKENLLSLIAWNNFEQGRYFIPQQSLERDIQSYIRHLPNAKEELLEADSEAILKGIEARHGLLVEQAAGVYSFSHLTVQEYFAARYAVEHETQGTLERLVAEYLVEPRWREVFLLVAEMLTEADRFLLSVRERIRLLATEHSLAPFLSKLEGCIREGAPFPPAACRALAIAEVDNVFTHTLDDQAHGIAVELASTLAEDIPTSGPDSDRDRVIDMERCRELRFLGDALRMKDYLTATQLLVDCMRREAYVAKETRHRLLEGLLDES